ncbi:hypothetical protein BO224_04210 [Erysipelotrichaceae bacterium NYU-BL-E8]|uniref:DUF4177 domain-containing protein n=3 Tax=Erysipelotrichales TaxID=526525 RepID=A0A1U7NH27_9FIRM|nr:hypothetical protein BM735_10710 [Erysipelotrichaceae bacterium NYU-BL-F16]OLU40790.1 hypothetical protein BO222_04285 [Ileibacterium valens]OLU41081.1 hypothetical protein BO224_04210 [Erysipelotrichaceae bacterium NYU-BL-E8]OLU44722.1 hypothetical protein BO223_07250 [Faecalibaculum rodentium]
MKMKQYKFKMIRTNQPYMSIPDLEQTTNEFSKEGWELKSVQHFDDILSFLLIFEREVQKEKP